MAPGGKSKGTVLVIEDDKNIAALVSRVLSEDGFEVRTADTVFIGRSALKAMRPSIIVLDRKLPDADGLELCAEIRQIPEWKSVPILFLSAMKSPADKIAGLRMGGDDYLAKPFSNGELLARVDALMRRSGLAESPHSMDLGDVKIDMDARQVFLKGKEVRLWKKEFDLLTMLIQHKNKVLTRDFLLQQVWDYGADAQPTTKVVDVLISHLRAKLGEFGGKIIAVRGMGYRLDLA